MLRVNAILLCLVVLLSLNAYAADTKEVKQAKNGWYITDSSVSDPNIYLVDPVAQLCYFTIGAVGQIVWHHPVSNVTLVPCKNLKKRPEWAPIITWD